MIDGSGWVKKHCLTAGKSIDPTDANSPQTNDGGKATLARNDSNQSPLGVAGGGR